MDDLLRWGYSKGATFKVTTSADHPRKFFAAEDLSPGDVVFSIPTAMLLHGKLALTDAAYGAAFKALLAELGPGACDERMLLVMLLVLERAKGKDSAWGPYIDMLPTHYDDPFWWSEQDLKLLRGTRLQQAVQKYNKDLLQLHTWINRVEQLQQQQSCTGTQPRLLSTALGGWGLTLDAIKWARSAVWSRAFTVRGFKTPSDSGTTVAAAASNASSSISSVIALVPVLDMCDHHPDQRVCWRVVDEVTQQQQQQQQGQQQQQQAQGRLQQQQQLFQFTTLKPVRKADELFNNYGTTKPNEELLLGYGFVLNPNPHDSFLVSISSRTTAAAGATQETTLDAADQQSSEADCEDAAVWQQRRAVIDASGLCMEVHVTLDNPLPDRLLDVLLIATAVQPWRLPELLCEVTELQSKLQEKQAHLKALDSSDQQQHRATSDSNDQQQQQLVQGFLGSLGLFAAASPGQQLKVLLQLKQQFTAKLQGMLPAQELQQLLLLPGTQQQQQQQQRCAGSSPHHARLAAVYVLSQQQVLQQALKAVQSATHQVLLRLTPQPGAAAAAEGGTPPLAAAAAAAVTNQSMNGEGGDHKPLQQNLQGLRLGPGLDWCPSCKTLVTISLISAGSTVLQIPLLSCLAAAEQQQLVMLLMLAAAGTISQQQQQQRATNLDVPQQQQQQQQQQHYWTDCWQQQQQLLPWWLQEDLQELVEILQDTPAGQQLLDASQELQSDFQALLQYCSTTAAAAAAASTQPDQQQPQQQQLLQLFQQDQSATYKLFCWACRVVQQGSWRIHIDQEQQQQQQQQQQGQQQQQQGQQQQHWVLVPTLELVPQDLRNLTLSVTVSHGHQQQQQQQQQQLLTVTAACDLPAQLQLNCSSSLAGDSCYQQLLIDQGPAAAAEISTAAAAAAAAKVHHVYELVVCPSEEDSLHNSKLQLLGVTGVGLTHCLTLPTVHTAPQQQQQQQQQQEGAVGSSAQQQQQQEGAVGSSAQQQQQQQLETVLAAMAVALCDDEQLLQPHVIKKITEQQQQQPVASVTPDPAPAAAAGVVDDTAAVVVGTTNLLTISTSSQIPPAESEQTAWQNLKRQLLKRYSKACRKQLNQVLKADLQAVKQAVQQLAELQEAVQQPDMAAGMEEVQMQQQQDVPRSSCCCSSKSSSSSGPVVPPAAAAAQSKVLAAAGLQEYLNGLTAVLMAWNEQLKVFASNNSSSSSSSSRKATDSRKNAAAEPHNRKSKRQRQKC